MEQFFNKLENYNILNYILPAIVFDFGCQYYINVDLISTNNVFASAFLYYFLGLVISRIGSLFVKPLLWKLKILNVKDSSVSKNFFQAEEKDPKIKILFADYNMYRNFISTFLLLLIGKLIYILNDFININSTIFYTALLIFLLILFIISYKKQLSYIHSRVEYINNENNQK